MEEFRMTKEHRPILTDEILHFLYRNASFQALEEKQQQILFAKFKNEPLFKEVIEISIALEEMIEEVEATMPKIQDKDFLFPQEQQKLLLKNRTVSRGNVLFVPFEELEKIYSPMIVMIQQSDSMSEYEAFSKGTIMPLFNLCALQKRDLIILPFSHTTAEPLLFKNGALDVSLFERFLYKLLNGTAQIVPALEKVLELFSEDSINNQRDLMIITDNQFNDFQPFIESDFTERLLELSVDTSVIAISEADFEVQPIPFADKVFFANE